ncbi:MAG TPA: ubiquinol oxidase subunit II [Candidatus Saccharimonadales bacterium]|nr:ubiquinol oxidase subunit II [Candidatus Saccharimonadales bacterium]
MRKKYSVVGIVVGLGLLIAAVTAVVVYLHGHTVAIFEPRGTVGRQERQLIITALLLSIIVIIPVFTMLGFITFRYRAGNQRAKYSPDLSHNRLAETIWWAVPGILILILSVITWRSSHQLDPYKPLASNAKPLTIQVVALQWKWLFIYPEQHIATVNYVQFPEKTPVNFEITADAPMNSLWIPQLGGQVYAMPGMTSQLHLMADATGNYRGSSANISGKGFAGMTFSAQSTSAADFAAWVAATQQSTHHLDQGTYATLAQPSENVPPTMYATTDQSLYETILMKFMMPSKATGAPTP